MLGALDIMDWDILKYIVGPPVFILVILLALVLHELGHYWAARIFGMPVKAVVIGRGKTFRHWNDRYNTRWSIRRWPVGAYVHLEGHGDDQTSQFARYPFWQRALTTLAGPLCNFAILPFLFFGFYLAFGQPSAPAVLVGVEKGYAAQKAGLKPGDRFTAVDGIPISNKQDIWRILYAKKVAESRVTILRGEENFDVTLTPEWAEYLDHRGVPRKNARFGVVWQHTPFKLEAITSVNGKETNDDDERTRALLIQNFDRDIVIGLKGPDEEPGDTEIHLSGSVNKGLLDPEHDDYEHVFLGKTPGNIYLYKPVLEQLVNALRYSARLIKTIASVPFQLFPIDKSSIHDKHAVSNPDTWLINKIYAVMHLFAVASVAIGLINLLPLPNLDGGQFMIQAFEKGRKTALTRKQKAKIFAAAFLVFYLSVLFSNMDNMSGYIDSRLEKVHDFIDQHNQENEGEGRDG